MTVVLPEPQELGTPQLPHKVGVLRWGHSSDNESDDAVLSDPSRKQKLNQGNRTVHEAPAAQTSTQHSLTVGPGSW